MASNPFGLGVITGGLEQYTPQGQLSQQQIQMNKQAMELNQLNIQQQQFALQQERAQMTAMMSTYNSQSQGVNNPVDSSGGIDQTPFGDIQAIPKPIAQQISTLYAQGNAAYKNGYLGYAKFFKQAEDLKKEALANVAEEFKAKQDVIEAGAQFFNSATDEDSYKRLQLNLAAHGKDIHEIIPNATGNWDDDKGAVQDIQRKALTVEQNVADERATRTNERQEQILKDNETKLNAVLDNMSKNQAREQQGLADKEKSEKTKVDFETTKQDNVYFKAYKEGRKATLKAYEDAKSQAESNRSIITGKFSDEDIATVNKLAAKTVKENADYEQQIEDINKIRDAVDLPPLKVNSIPALEPVEKTKSTTTPSEDETNEKRNEAQDEMKIMQAAQRVGWTYEPDKYNYRINPDTGKLQRALK